MIQIHRVPTPPARDAEPHPVVHALADVEAEVARLEAAGVEVVTAPHAIFGHEDDMLGPAGTDEWQAFVRDSEGNTVALIEWRAA